MMRRLASLALAACALAASSVAQANPMLEPITARAREAITRLDVAEAHTLLDKLPETEPQVALELALLAIYEGNCDRAVTLLSRPNLAHTRSASTLGEIARGCARTVAATVEVRDDARGVVLRFKDDADVPLAPFLFDVAERSLAALDRDLRVQLPRPVRIEVVRDHYSLAAMTGLPEEAAQTTGTVAVAKWGRVIMLSPRASSHGFPWADTLMHELTHLAITRASVDHAPLWLQEGVAKRHEVRWRDPSPFDDRPAPEIVARLGLEAGLGVPIDKLGPSIAMLPTAEQAMVAFAEVHSFIRFWQAQSPEGSLSKLLYGLADKRGDTAVDDALREVSGETLSAWNDKWQKAVMRVSVDVPQDLLPYFARKKKGKEAHDDKAEAPDRDVLRRARLAELLQARGHHAQAATYLEKVVKAEPHDASARGRLALSLRALGRDAEAAQLVSSLDAVHHDHPLFEAMRGAALRDRGDDAASAAFRAALWQSPLDPVVACTALPGDRDPEDPAQAALCRASRQR